MRMEVLSKRSMIGVFLLAVQVGLVAHARFVPEKWFCWAPFDEHVAFSVQATVNGVELSPAEIAGRYRIRHDGAREYHALGNITSKLIQWERSYGREDEVTIRMKYRINGKEEKEWLWQSP